MVNSGRQHRYPSIFYSTSLYYEGLAQSYHCIVNSNARKKFEKDARIKSYFTVQVGTGILFQCLYFSRTLCGRFCQAYQFRYTIFRMNVILSTMQTGIICNEFGSNCIGFVIPHCDFLLKYITPNTNSGCFNTLRPKQNCRHFPKHFNERKCMIFA